MILNKEKNPLFIERKEHDITRGFSILQSCSPYTHQEGWTYPHSLDNIRWYFEQEVDYEPSDYDIDLLGIARNVRKGINYYFYVFRVDFHVEKPNISIKTEEDTLKGFCDLDSSHLLRGNKVDLLVMRALFPEFYVSRSEVEGCILHEDPDHTLRDTLFTTKEVKIRPNHVADTVKDRIRFCIVQLNFSVDYLPPPNKFAYVLKEKDKVEKKVFNALEIAKEEEVNIICFPELSFTKEWIYDRKIRELYQEMIIIGGSYYENEFNTCPVKINGNIIPIQKANPSPNKEGELGKRGMKHGKENFVFQTKYGRFVVLICFDYRNEVSKILDSTDEKIKNVDFIIVPEHNDDVETFQKQADTDCQKEPYPYILQVNKYIKEKKGGTCVIGTEHNDSLQRYKNDGYRRPSDELKYNLIEAKGEMMIIVDLDIKRKGVPVPGSGYKMNPIGCYVYKTDKWIQDKINIWP